MLMMGSAPASPITDEARLRISRRPLARSGLNVIRIQHVAANQGRGRTGRQARYRGACDAAIFGHVLDQNGDSQVDAGVWLLQSEYELGILRQTVIGPKFAGEDGSYAFTSDLEPNRRYYLLADRDRLWPQSWGRAGRSSRDAARAGPRRC